MKLKKRNRTREIEELEKGLHILSINYNKQTLEKFQTYINMLHEYHDKVHLLSQRDYSRISRRHFLTSLVALPYLAGRTRVCDIGAGAGFPSIPLSMMMPDINFTLFESKRKKTHFLEHLIRVLQLSRVRVINDRAEYYKAGRFDAIVIKASGKIKKLIKVVDHLIIEGGDAIFYKCHSVEDEIKSAEREIKKRGFQVRIEKLTTPIEQLPLALVVLRKTRTE